jgi:hypothetical protein
MQYAKQSMTEMYVTLQLVSSTFNVEECVRLDKGRYAELRTRGIFLI